MRIFQALIYIIFFIPFFTLNSCKNEENTYTAAKTDITESVYTSVTIEPQSMYKVNALNAGYIDELFVQTGDEVKAGQVLFAIRDIVSDANADNARLQFEMAKRNYSGSMSLLEDMKLELSDAAYKRKNDSINFERVKKLYSNELASKLEFEQAENLFTSSKTRHQLILNKIKRSKVDLQTSLAQAKNNFHSSLSRAGDALVRSEIDGIVYDVLKESGEFVSVQEPVSIIGSKSDFVIKMRIDEVDITKTHIGQTMIVKLEAYQDTVFKAIVTRISPKMDPQTQTFEIDGKFLEMPNKLFSGLTGEGNIIISERKSVIAIPLEYLVEDEFVLTKKGKIRVQTGARSLSHIEIVDGISEGAVILKPE